jgi:hypothetical protein
VIEQELFGVHECPEYVLEDEFRFWGRLVVGCWGGEFGFEFGDFLVGGFSCEATDEEFDDDVIGVLAVFQEFFDDLTASDFSFDRVSIQEVECLRERRGDFFA